ncbi:GTP cyclohydrolase II [Vibrio cholerae]
MIRIRDRVAIKLSNFNNVEAEFISFNHLEDGKEHIAIKFPKQAVEPPHNVRVHSECLTGDLFSSSRCDCGEQLDFAVDYLSRNGGYLIYLRQEGRGIGLYNKLSAYKLQDLGYNTYEANQKLGFKSDERDFEVSANILHSLGVSRVNLITNNPQKLDALKGSGIAVVSVINMPKFVKSDNKSYLETKQHQGKHQFKESKCFISQS